MSEISKESTLNKLKIHNTNSLFQIHEILSFEDVTDFITNFSFVVEFIQSSASGIEVKINSNLDCELIKRSKILQCYATLKRSYILVIKQSNCENHWIIWSAKNKKTSNCLEVESEILELIVNFLNSVLKNEDTGGVR